MFKLILAAAVTIFLVCFYVSCGGGKSDLRSLAPKGTILYLESPDLGRLLRTMTANETFRAASSSAVDLSAVDGIEIAVAVTGFEASESKVTDEEAVLNFKPTFILLAETHAWSWQVDRLVTEVLGRFVRSSYGEQAKLEKKVREGLDWYVWASADGRMAFAAVSGSRVFFGNDEEAVLKCISVQAGKEPSLMEDPRVSRQYENAAGKLAFGYVSEEGVKQLSNFAGISVALERSDEAGAQSVISSIFPQMIDNSVSEVVWTAKESGRGIEDNLDIRLDPKLAEAFSEALKPANAEEKEMFELVPANAYSVTRYNMKTPRIAFRSLVIGAAGKVSPDAARYVPALGAALLEPYGVADPEAFLGAADPYILTVRLDADGDEGIAIVSTNDYSAMERSFPDELIDGSRSSVGGAELRTSEDGSFAVGRKGDLVVLGDKESVEKCLLAAEKQVAAPAAGDIRYSGFFADIRRPEHTVITVSRDRETASKLASLFGGDSRIRVTESMYAVRTDFDRQGIRRTYFSPFGIAGSIIIQFSDSP